MKSNFSRKRNLYNPDLKEPFRLSRTKIDLFLECPRCFYLDRRLGVSRPSIPGFSLNNAVDNLLKKEFDILRKKRETHKLIKQYGIEAVPFSHPDLTTWRDDCYKYIGASVLHKETNLEISGIIDDIWINPKEELIIVDYKATSTNKEISLDDQYKQGYKKQLEVYQWIFKKLNFKVSDIGYFVFANADKDKSDFSSKLEFKLSIITYKSNDSWIEPTLFKIKKCLDSKIVANQSIDCEHCNYRESANKFI